MKRIISLLTVFTLLFCLAACSNNTPEGDNPSSSRDVQSSVDNRQDQPDDSQNPPLSSEENSDPADEPTETGSKALVVYFSHSGNTESVAKEIQSQTDADIFEIVAMYGYQEGKNIPITGLNADDAFFAGQILIWEYQQGIRTDAEARKNNGPIKADLYYNLLKGRPAEKMYDYLLDKIRQHSIVPSFTSKDRLHPAEEIVLEYNSNTGKYSKTIEDKNKTGIDIAGLSVAGVTITRSGNSYTITSDKSIDTAVTLNRVLHLLIIPLNPMHTPQTYN